MSYGQRPAARERILGEASALFYRRGINNVGIDEIVVRSGVAKMSLYNHFGSKEGLVLEFLGREEERWWAWLETELEQRSDTPGGRLLAVFDALGEWFASPDFRGCAFINAAVEIADTNHPIHEACRVHWQRLRTYLLGFAQDAGIADPEATSEQLSLLVEGAIVAALLERTTAPARRARRIAESILDKV